MLSKRKILIYSCSFILIFSTLQFNIDRLRDIYYWGELKLKINELKDKKYKYFQEIKNIKKVYIIANKTKKIMTVYIKVNESDMWAVFTSYSFTGTSGDLGSKIKEYDGQIPEGIYKPVFLNALSNYYLSIGINYPNEFDRKKGIEDNRNQLGNNIFIHGSKVSIGCIPIGDENIEELFILIEQTGIENTTIVIIPNELDTFPNIEDIEWEKELYNDIKKELVSENLF